MALSSKREESGKSSLCSSARSPPDRRDVRVRDGARRPGIVESGRPYYFGSETSSPTWPTYPPTQVYSSLLLQNLTESSARTVNGNTVCAASYTFSYVIDTAVVCSNDQRQTRLPPRTGQGAADRRALRRTTGRHQARPPRPLARAPDRALHPVADAGRGPRRPGTRHRHLNRDRPDILSEMPSGGRCACCHASCPTSS